jgi:hypothetical protein
VKYAPSLPTLNRFAVLAPEPEEKSKTPNDEDTFARNPLPKGDTRPQEWERHLLMALVRAVAPSPNSLCVKIEIQTTDMAVVVGAHALLDSSTTGLFVDEGFVWAHGLTTHEVTCPIPVYNINGTLNKAGAIREVVDMILRYKGHSECMALVVTWLRKEQVILGYPWL